MNMKSIFNFIVLVLIGFVLICAQPGFGQTTASKSNQTQQKSANKEGAAKQESAFDRLLKELKRKKELVLIRSCFKKQCKPTKAQAIDGRVIRGKIKEGEINIEPAPLKYPPAARAVGASGSVVVQMIFSEAGSVIATQAVSGHPLLREACLQSVGGIRLSPTLVDAKPVKLLGTYTCNFELQIKRTGM